VRDQYEQVNVLACMVGTVVGWLGREGMGARRYKVCPHISYPLYRYSRDVYSFLKKTAIAYRPNTSKRAKFCGYAIAGFFKNA